MPNNKQYSFENQTFGSLCSKILSALLQYAIPFMSQSVCCCINNALYLHSTQCFFIVIELE